MNLVDYYGTSFVVFFVASFEITAIMWVYGLYSCLFYYIYIYIFVFRINCYFYLHLKIKAFYYIFTNRYRKFLKRRGIHAGQENRQLLENLLVSCHTFDFVIYFLLYICYSTTIDLRRKRISDFSPCGWHSRILLGNFSNTFLDDREIVKKQKFAIVKGNLYFYSFL